MRDPNPGFELLAGVAAASLLLALGAPLAAANEGAPDWNAVADVETIYALTTDEQGRQRETKIWLAVLGDQGYIRTSRSTRWGKDVLRDPNVAVRIGGVEYPVLITFVEDAALRADINAVFREKYGWTDRLLGVFRGSEPYIMRLNPHTPEP